MYFFLVYLKKSKKTFCYIYFVIDIFNNKNIWKI